MPIKSTPPFAHSSSIQIANKLESRWEWFVMPLGTGHGAYEF